MLSSFFSIVDFWHKSQFIMYKQKQWQPWHPVPIVFMLPSFLVPTANAGPSTSNAKGLYDHRCIPAADTLNGSSLQAAKTAEH